MWRFSLSNLGKLLLTFLICFTTIILIVTLFNDVTIKENVSTVEATPKPNNEVIEYVFPAAKPTPTVEAIDSKIYVEQIENFTIYFGPGDSNVTIESQPEVDKLLKFIGVYRIVNVKIYGNVANVGIHDPEFDEQLSFNRANAIKARLVMNGVPEGVIEVYSNGIDNQLAATDELDVQQVNRRVDVELSFLN